jgi:replicative DNA helicase
MFIEELHYSRQLEKVILGSVLLEPTAFGRMYGIINPDVFYYEHHKNIFNVLSEMWEASEPIDICTATYCIYKKGFQIVDGHNAAWYVAEITKGVCSTANLEKHSLFLRQMYIEREMLKLTLSGTNGKDGLMYIDELQDKLVKLRQIKITDDFKNFDEVLSDLYMKMIEVKDRELSGITTGFRHLDKITGGLEPTGMYIVAARPSVGKTAFMGRMIVEAAKKGHKVGLITLEMDDKQIMGRMASLITEVEYWRIWRNRMYDQEQADKFYQIMNRSSNLPIKISDNASVNIGDIKSKVARLKQRNEIDVLFIDYLGLIDTDGLNKNSVREQEVSKISRGIKLMAKQYNIPIVLLCQLNRLSEQKGEKPKLHNLRESGSLEQDADGVLFIHRDFMSGKKTNEDGGSTENEADILVSKWRNGELAEIKIGFDGPKMKFYELDEMELVSSQFPAKAALLTTQRLIPMSQAIKNSTNFDDGMDEAAPF